MDIRKGSIQGSLMVAGPGSDCRRCLANEPCGKLHSEASGKCANPRALANQSGNGAADYRADGAVGGSQDEGRVCGPVEVGLFGDDVARAADAVEFDHWFYGHSFAEAGRSV